MVWKKFTTTTKEYLRNSSTPGYRYLIGKVTFERYFWCLFHMCTLLTTYYIALYTWDNFTSNPTMTTVQFYESYPVKKVAMPGISVCSINKISRKRAENYAEKLSQRSGTPIKDILKGLKSFSRLHDYSKIQGYDNTYEFQNFLEKYDSDPDGSYNTHDKLQMLQVPCSEKLYDCVFNHRRRKCEDLFVNDLTMEGHCCIFNYVSQSAMNFSTVVRENRGRPLLAGINKMGGLTFKIKHNLSDYFVTSLATTGIKILVSMPKDFPDVTSGSLIEELVGVGVEAFVRISGTVTFTTSEVKKYAIDKRGCIFPDETNTIFGGYSYSDCIMDCKIKSIGALCRCTPFNYIRVFKSQNYPQCTLADLKCLSSYAGKWSTLYPKKYENGDILEREKQNAMSCPNCVPACSDTQYSVKGDSAELYLKGKRVDNFSIVHVYFERPVVTFNKQDVFFYWYDMLGLFGGLCSLVMGISFICVVEMLYFFLYLFGRKLLRL